MQEYINYYFGEKYFKSVEKMGLPELLKAAAIEAFIHKTSNKNTQTIRKALIMLRRDGFL